MQLHDIGAHFLHVRESLHQNLYRAFVRTLLHSLWALEAVRPDDKWPNNNKNNTNNRIPIQY